MKIKEALGLWFKSKLVAQIEFTEWTPDGHLRHSKFVGLREDRAASGVVRRSRVRSITGVGRRSVKNGEIDYYDREQQKLIHENGFCPFLR